MHRQAKYLNNAVEADHGKLKQLIRPVRGFKTLKTAYATIKGFEVMRALRKGQAAAFNITRDICGEARIVERAFGLGACAGSETVQFVSERLQLQAARPSHSPHRSPPRAFTSRFATEPLGHWRFCTVCDPRRLRKKQARYEADQSTRDKE